VAEDAATAAAALTGASARTRLRRAALIAIALAGAALVAGCGDDSGSADRDSSALGASEVRLTAREASCTDWNEAGVEERQVIVAALEDTEGRPTTGAVGATLPEEQAYELFDGACAEDYARAFKLYKIYVRAAAFSGDGQ
jgi:hypothetical protein